jgi:isochorismate synthase
VGDFISEKLQEIGAKFAKSETYNRRAGNVQHICNDFTADNLSSTQIEKLKRLLHPTPAISGLPQRDAVEYVMKHEGHKRLYYGGYIGPIYANGDFDFYVNLRSMMFDGSKCCIYSGGGLTAASNADDEWEETELKSRLLSEYV